MWFSTLSGLYPRLHAQDPVPARLNTLALLAWFSWLASWGWMLVDLMDGVPIVAIFGGQELAIDYDHVNAQLPRWAIQLGVHLVVCLAVHVAQVVHAMNLPFHKLPVVLPWVRADERPPTKPELLARLLDHEAAHGGFQLATVRAFAHHADLSEWATRRKVLQTWVRLQLTDLDGRIRAGERLILAPEGEQQAKDRSMELQVVHDALRYRPPPTV